MKNGFVCLLIFAAAFRCDTIKNPEHTVTGLWKLSNIDVQDSVTGRWHQADWMKNGSGYLHYDGSQYMSALISSIKLCKSASHHYIIVNSDLSTVSLI